MPTMTQPDSAPQHQTDAPLVVEVTGGVDTHKDTHTAAAIDAAGRSLGCAQFPTTPAGYAALLAWLRRFGTLVLVGIEGTGVYGAGLALHLHLAGVAMVEIDRPDRKARRWQGRSDPVDAEAAALAAAVNAEAVQPGPVIRGRGQIMADTLVERITGQALAPDVPVEIQVVIPVEALADPDSPLPAQIPGYGPVPAELITTSQGRKAWRRLVTRDGIVIGGDSRRRRFTGHLAALIRARDGHRCREPYCDAPIRHIDHVRRWRELGRTEFDNGRGLCEFHNQVRETPGWEARVTTRGIETITPTGQAYTSDYGAA